MGELQKRFLEIQAKLAVEEQAQRLEALLRDVSKAVGPEGPMGPQGPKGDTGERGERGEKGETGPQGIPGKNGLNGNDGANGKDGLNGKDGSPDQPIEIAGKLNTTTESVDISVIKGLKDMLAKITSLANARIKTKGGGRIGGGGDIMMIEDLSSQTNDTLKVFTVPYSRKAIKVEMSDAPHHLYEGNGFTLNTARTQLTLTVNNAPTTGSQLAFIYII